MQINITFDQNIATLPAGFVAGVDYVANYFDSLFTNPVTVNIRVGYGEIAGQLMGAGALGESLANNFYPLAYGQVVAALKANEPTAAQQAAYATLPVSSPFSAARAMFLAPAEQK